MRFMARIGSGGSDMSIIGGLVSLVLPGLGLLLTKEKKVSGIAIFVIAVLIDFLVLVFGAVGTLLCIIGFMLWIIIPIVHIVAALYTYDSIKKEQGMGGFIFN